MTPHISGTTIDAQVCSVFFSHPPLCSMMSAIKMNRILCSCDMLLEPRICQRGTSRVKNFLNRITLSMQVNWLLSTDDFVLLLHEESECRLSVIKVMLRTKKMYCLLIQCLLFFFGAKFCANNVPAPYGALCTLCFQKQIQSCNEFLTFDVYNAKFIFYQYGWWLINLQVDQHIIYLEFQKIYKENSSSSSC